MVALVSRRSDVTQYWVIHQVVMKLIAVVFRINFIRVRICLFIIHCRIYDVAVALRTEMMGIDNRLFYYQFR